MTLSVPTINSIAAANATRPAPRILTSLGWSAEQLCLLRGELLVGKDALAVQRGDLLELLDRVGRRRGRRLVVRGFSVRLLLVGSRVLCAPAPRLAAAHSVRDRGRGAGDRGGAGHPAK